MATLASQDITGLLTAWGNGDEGALNGLMPMVYPELRRIATRFLHNERDHHTLEPTALVNELYLELVNAKGLGRDGSDGEIHRNDKNAFLALAAQTQNQRGYGDFWGHMLVAQGSGDVMAEHGVHVWDVAAVKPIIEEAGGRYSDWDGRQDIFRPDVLVSNGKVHEASLHLLQGGP